MFEDGPTDVEKTIINVVGWIYFFAWSISFYGQIYTNFKLKTYRTCNILEYKA